jgi:superoxide dismutase, Fe-Mn family
MFKLPPLPYAKDALAPYMSAETLGYHHGKHHKAYVDKLNELTGGSPMARMSLEEIILKTQSARDENSKKIFNNAAQSWNHEFFWSSMTPDGGGKPDAELTKMFDASFGSLSKFKDAFKTAATEHFGSGWAWIVADGDMLEIMTTHDADLPLAHGKHAVLACDLWEHAYYLDYQNARPKFIDAFLGELANWDFMVANLDAARVAA